ncbi:MAG: flagellar basal body-associated FliL family protein [Candidatus Polarisedimenticolaceae bacterium]|nr:flagellar basal body-associated FliL family protein [Candidatus Polarisedimenticolaceae bacterium]
MAKEDNEIEDAEDDLDLGNEKAPGRKKLIILVAGVFLLLNIALGAYFFFFLNDEESVDGVEGVEGVEGEVVEEVVEEDDTRPTFYHAIDALVVSLEGKPSLLQIGVQVRVRGEDMADFLAHNDPMIRHEFLGILGVQDGKKLKKRANKEALQQALLVKLRQVVVELSGPDPERDIEAIYFVSFVTQ